MGRGFVPFGVLWCLTVARGRCCIVGSNHTTSGCVYLHAVLTYYIPALHLLVALRCPPGLHRAVDRPAALHQLSAIVTLHGNHRT